MIKETIKLCGNGMLTAYLWEYSAELGIETRPAILVIPGGGYEFCSDKEADPIAMVFAAEGFDTFVLRYTVKKTFKEPLAEANAAMRVICDNAEKWRIGKNQISVIGFSAGGHLACALGTMGDIKPNAMILGYPAVLGKDWATHKPCIPDVVCKVDSDTSPAFIFASRDDDIVPINNSIQLASALDRSGVPFELHIFGSGKHGYSLAKYHTCNAAPQLNAHNAKWLELSVEWLKRTIGDITYKN